MYTAVFVLVYQDKKISQIEVTADFNRLSILLMRLDDSSGLKEARKVATATMSCARVQATVGKPR